MTDAKREMILEDRISRLELFAQNECERRHWEGLHASISFLLLALVIGLQSRHGIVAGLAWAVIGSQFWRAIWHLEYVFKPGRSWD